MSFLLIGEVFETASNGAAVLLELGFLPASAAVPPQQGNAKGEDDDDSLDSGPPGGMNAREVQKAKQDFKNKGRGNGRQQFAMPPCQRDAVEGNGRDRRELVTLSDDGADARISDQQRGSHRGGQGRDHERT